MATVHFAENALIVGKSANTRPKSARSAKGICKVVALVNMKGAVPAMVVPKRLAMFVE